MTDSNLDRDSWWDMPGNEMPEHASGFAPMKKSQQSRRASRWHAAALFAFVLALALALALSI